MGASGRDIDCGSGGCRAGHGGVGNEGGLTLIGRDALENLLQRVPEDGVQAALRLAKDLHGETLQLSRRQFFVQRHGVQPGRLQHAGGRGFLLGYVLIGSHRHLSVAVITLARLQTVGRVNAAQQGHIITNTRH